MSSEIVDLPREGMSDLVSRDVVDLAEVRRWKERRRKLFRREPKPMPLEDFLERSLRSEATGLLLTLLSNHIDSDKGKEYRDVLVVPVYASYRSIKPPNQLVLYRGKQRVGDLCYAPEDEFFSNPLPGRSEQNGLETPYNELVAEGKITLLSLLQHYPFEQGFMGLSLNPRSERTRKIYELTREEARRRNPVNIPPKFR